MRLQDLNWMDVERYLQQDNRIILITGATEQHAYLSLLTDILIPSRMALAVAERTGVLVAPPLNFGVSELYIEYPGTITLSRQCFDNILSEIVEGLMHQGFERFFIFNGNGGNTLPARLRDLHMDGIVRLDWYNWWRDAAVRQFEQRYNLRLDHANWGENFSFTRVSDMPTGTKQPVNLELFEEAHNVREVLGDGSYGGPYQIDDSMMQTLFMQIVEEAALRVEALR